MLQTWLQRGAAPSLQSVVPSKAIRHVHRPALRLPLGQPAPAAGRAVRRGVVCMAGGLEIGKPYSAAAAKPASSFEELSLSPALLEAMAAAGLSKPTEIQAMAVPAIMAGGDCLLASQTGSGKTLAYLLPLVHMLKQQEGELQLPRRAKRPKIVVLGPTKELVEQITSVAKSLCHHAKFRPVGLTAFSSTAAQAKLLSGPVDVVVATPTRLLQHMTANNVALGDVRWLVIDEADTMFDQGFGEEVTKLLGALKGKQPPVQVVLVSATMTRAVKRLATAQLPDIVRLEAAGFHRPTAGARQEFRVLPPGGDKLQMLLEVLQGDVRKGRKVLVFCGSVDSCRAVEHFCQDRDLPTVCYHGEMPPAARRESMSAFAGAAAAAAAGDDGEADAAPSIMVASDLAARGLDFPGTIDHVVNFDFPTNAIDYLHRAGRTARAGATGRVTSLVGPRDRRLANAIQYALDKGLPLDQVTASGAGPAPQQQQQAQQRPGSVKYSPAKRPRGPAAVPGQMQQVAWNPDHRFLHLRPQDGEPVVPFKELLKGKTGDERKRLLYEIAMDVKEWRRWRHAKAVRSAAARRAKQEPREASAGAGASRQQNNGRRGSGGGRRGGGGGGQEQRARGQPQKAASPEERWKQKVAKKRARKE